MSKAKLIKVIVLRTITDFDNKVWQPSEEFEGLELSAKDYKHFDKSKAIKPFIDLAEYEEDE